MLRSCEGICEFTTEIQCVSYSGIRVFRGDEWLPIVHTLLSNQEAQTIIDTYALSSWCCGVAVLRDIHNEPINNSIPIANIAREIADDFLVVGEIGDSNVHHSHFLLKSPRRVDVVRRSILSYIDASTYKIDICKLANCRVWQGMFMYLLKNPLMVFCGTDQLANLAFTAIENGTPLKYLHKDKSNVKPIVKIITDIITKHNCVSVEDVFKHGSTQLTEYLHLSSLQTTISNCLMFNQAAQTTLNLSSFKYAPDKDPEIIHRILLFQNVDVDFFDNLFWKWINKKNGKVNTIILLGPSNTGKTSFIRGLLQLIPSGNIVNSSSPFFAEGICGKYIAVWEEPLLISEQADCFKLIAEGSPLSIPQKFKKPFLHEGSPLIITTNHPITRFCSSEEIPIANRCITISWSNIICSFRGSCSENCIYHRQQQRRSTPCRISWSPSSGDFDWKSKISSSGNSLSSSINFSLCGRWWCGSNNGRPCSYCGRTKIKRSDSRGFSFSSSSTTSGNLRSSSGDTAGSSGNRISSGSSKSILRSSEQSGHSSTRDNRSLGGGDSYGLGSSGDRRNFGTLESVPECQEVSCWGDGRTNQGNTENQKTEIGKICTCLIEPIPQDWQAYLAYLASKYE